MVLGYRWSRCGCDGTKIDPMKQLRTSLGDLRALFNRSVTVSHVAERLECCRADEDAAVVRQRMQRSDFDVLGVEEGDEVYGYVERSGLDAGSCGQYHRTFHPSDLIAESTPLIDLLPILRDRSRVFVLDRNRVNSIVTRGDLQKAPGRMLLFGLVTLLEMHLLRLVRRCYRDGSWQDLVNKKRLQSAMDLLEQRKARNEAIDLADCLQFCDKSDLVVKSPQVLEGIGLSSKKSAAKFFREVQDLRDKLAHAQDIVTGSSWPAVIELAKEIESLVERCEEAEETITRA